MKFFKISEFACGCGCGAKDMDPGFLKQLDLARHISGVPWVITSGKRCPKHNKAVGGVDDSEHTLGKGADVKAENSVKRLKIVRGALAAGIERIGVGKDFVHLGSDGLKGSPVMWLYG